MAQSADKIYGKRQFLNTLNQTLQVLFKNSHLLTVSFQRHPTFQILKKKQNKTNLKKKSEPWAIYLRPFGIKLTQAKPKF